MADLTGVGLDLGSDTLKIAYAYGKTAQYGKFIDDRRSPGVGIPAVAYYDGAKNAWFYGDEVDANGSGSFITVVKIRELMSLVSPRATAEASEKNLRYYREGNMFPKFCFPVRRSMLDDFGEMVRRDLTFEARGWTPERVCEGYFEYAAELVARDAGELSARRPDGAPSGLKLALLYPQTADKPYIAEYERLTEKAFGRKADKVLPFAKALGMYAFENGMIGEGESLLIFDMGESAVTVSKASIAGGSLVVDGVDGHNEPLHRGGCDVDGAIAEYISGTIDARETVGYPSYGEDGHISEKFLHSKLYLLMKEIKGAKVMLGSERADPGRPFAAGVPVSVGCDLYIERMLTRGEMMRACGISDNTGVAKEIADYIISELERPVNRDVGKVFLSGGLTETYAFADYIRSRARAKFPRLVFYPEDPAAEKRNDGFNIMRNEDSVYAPAVGGAIVALKNYNVRTAIALTYATWVTWNRKVCLAVIADRGMQLADGEKEYPYKNAFTVSGSCIEHEKIFSAVITSGDIAAMRFPGLTPFDFTPDSPPHLIIGDDGSPDRKRISRVIALKTVSGENGATINYYHRGARVQIIGGEVTCVEGMRISADGRAKPFIRNAEKDNRKMITVKYFSRPSAFGRPDMSVNIGYPVRVRAKEIYVGFVGIDEVIDIVVG